MANTKTAKQRILTNERNRLRNIAVKSRMRTYMKAALTAVETGGEAVQPAVTAALSEIDRAVKKGIIHPNSGARKKSAIQRRLAAKSK